MHIRLAILQGKMVLQEDKTPSKAKQIAILKEEETAGSVYSAVIGTH
jgi:hypothetical protein